MIIHIRQSLFFINLISDIIKYCCWMDSSQKARLDLIVNSLKQKNNVASLLQGGKGKEKGPTKKEKENNFDLNSEELHEAQLLFNIPPQNKDESKKKEAEKKTTLPKSILRAEKPEPEPEEIVAEEVDKKSKSVSFYEEGKPIYMMPIDKKWSDKVQNQKKGKFEAHEQKALCDAVGQFLACNQIQFDEFKKIISEGSNAVLRKQKFYKLLSSVLPDRSPESCYKYIKRQFNTQNYQGVWSQEDVDKLLALVDKYGRKWKLIAKELNRTSDNVYDKYRSLGEEGLEDRVQKMWKIRELITFLTLIQEQSQLEFLDPKVKDLLTNEEEHDKKEEKELTDRHYNTKKFVFHNLDVLRPFVDQKKMRMVNLDKIRWKKIMREIPTKSIFDCRNKFVQILQILFKNSEDLDSVMLDFLEKQNVTEESKVNWKKWKHKEYSADEARNRFMIMKKLIEGRSMKSFTNVLQEMRARQKKKSKPQQ